MSDVSRARVLLRGKQIVHVICLGSAGAKCSRCGKSLIGIPYVYAGLRAAEVYTLSEPVNRENEVSCLAV